MIYFTEINIEICVTESKNCHEILQLQCFHSLPRNFLTSNRFKSKSLVGSSIISKSGFPDKLAPKAL
jgi:hypothetical protein